MYGLKMMAMRYICNLVLHNIKFRTKTENGKDELDLDLKIEVNFKNRSVKAQCGLGKVRLGNARLSKAWLGKNGLK